VKALRRKARHGRTPGTDRHCVLITHPVSPRQWGRRGNAAHAHLDSVPLAVQGKLAFVRPGAWSLLFC